MSAREKYQQHLSTLDEALLSGNLQVGDEVIDMRTPDGWKRYEQECVRLKEIGAEVLVEEARTTESERSGHE